MRSTATFPSPSCSSDVKIGKGAKVEYSILMPGAVVEEGATVRYSIVAEKAVIAKGAEVGGSPCRPSDVDNWGVAVVAEGVRIGSGASWPLRKWQTRICRT